jgi:hypothetical protein
LINRIDVVRTNWPEWNDREKGAFDGMAPEWAMPVLTKGISVFSEAGPLEPIMLAILMRNGQRIAVIRSKHTVLLIRPADLGKTPGIEPGWPERFQNGNAPVKVV